MIHPTAVIDRGATLGTNVQVWHFSHIMAGAIVEDNCSLGQNVVIHQGASLGKGCRVQNNVSVYTNVHCEEEVFLGPSCVFTNVINPRAFIPRKDEYRPTYIERGASIGANATIICGIRIGAFALIGAGSVVSKDVKAYALVYGNPAKQHGWVSNCGHKLNFNHEGYANCPQCGEGYQLQKDNKDLKVLRSQD